MKISSILNAAAAAFVLSCAPAFAVTWNFSGVLTSSGTIGGSALVGKTFEGTAEIDTDSLAVTSLAITLIADPSLSFTQPEISPGILFNFASGVTGAWGLGADVTGSQIDGKDPSSATLGISYIVGAENSLGGNAPTFDDFDAAAKGDVLFLDIYFGQDFSSYLIGQVTSIVIDEPTTEISNVPVPLSALLLLTGVVGLGALRARST